MILSRSWLQLIISIFSLSRSTTLNIQFDGAWIKKEHLIFSQLYTSFSMLCRQRSHRNEEYSCLDVVFLQRFYFAKSLKKIVFYRMILLSLAKRKIVLYADHFCSWKLMNFYLTIIGRKLNLPIHFAFVSSKETL